MGDVSVNLFTFNVGEVKTVSQSGNVMCLKQGYDFVYECRVINDSVTGVCCEKALLSSMGK